MTMMRRGRIAAAVFACVFVAAPFAPADGRLAAQGPALQSPQAHVLDPDPLAVVRVVPLVTKDLVFDPASSLIFASVPGAAVNGNSITTINPVAGSTGPSVFIGSEPGKLALSDDSRYLYVSLDGAAAVRRFDTLTRTPGLQFSLGSDPNSGPFYVEDMFVLRGYPNSIAVSRRNLNWSPRHEGVAIYDSGVPRTVTTPDHTGSNVIEPSSNPAVLYGYNNETTEYGLRRMAIAAGGVSTTNNYQSVITGFNVDISVAGDTVYSTTGRAVNPETGQLLGTYTLSQLFNNNLVFADARAGRVYFLTTIGNVRTIQVFDMATFLSIGTIPVPAANSGIPSSLIRWGRNGLAFRMSTGQVFLVETSLIPPAETPGDFDGDGRTDLAVWRPSSGTWYTHQSSDASFRAHAFGLAGDVMTPGDYDGDGKADVAVWRPSNGVWYLWESSTAALRAAQFGLAGDLPAARDYDGDRRTDLAVYRPSEGRWYIWNSGTDTFTFDLFGLSGDVPVSMDYDGDNRADIAVFRQSTGVWYFRRSSNGTVQSYPFGLPGDRPVPGDYDGDGRADLGVYRPTQGLWYIFQSATNTVRIVHFGLVNDVPAPGDFDGDGRTDIAIYRDGLWFIQRSSDAVVVAPWFGLAGDKPVPASWWP